MGYSSSTPVKKFNQPTEQEEERNRERKVDDENNKSSDKDEATFAADNLFRSMLDKALSKEKDSSQDTQYM